jgi:hypothetical protein
MHSKLLSWLFLVGLFAAFTLEAAAQQQPGKIIAARVNGDVTKTIKATKVVSPIKSSDPLEQGCIVTTAKGASCILIFNNGATVNLGGDSVLDIEQFTQDPFNVPNFKPGSATDEPSVSKTKLTLTHGELVGKVAHLKTDQGSTFTVGTPVGAAGIRGTTFRIVYRPDGTGKAFFSMTTLEGNVVVTLATGTVTTPVSVTDNKEVVLADVTVTVNDQTGQVTVTTPTGTTVVPTDASATTLQQITGAAQQIAQAVVNTVLAPASPPAPNTPTTKTTSGDGAQ